jgi:hypothetical protein
MDKKYTVEATYTASMSWEIDFNLKKVYYWYMKYDVLYVQHTEMDTIYKEYEMSNYGEPDIKYPNKVYVAGFEQIYEEIL